jgi:hypothetical protein
MSSQEKVEKKDSEIAGKLGSHEEGFLQLPNVRGIIAIVAEMSFSHPTSIPIPLNCK